jgi:hypothetical protein
MASVAPTPPPAPAPAPAPPAPLSAPPPSPSWAAVQHESLPAAGSPAPFDYGAWILAHADESLLWHGVLDVPLLSPAGAAALADATAGALDAAAARAGVGSMHRYGTDLDPLFTAVLAGLSAAVEPIVEAAFLGGPATAPPPAAGAGPRRLLRHSGHAIGYAPAGNRERKLQLHVDDSLITVNVCLGRPGFTGSDLFFVGAQPSTVPGVARAQRRLPKGAAEAEVRGAPVPGRALIHFGRHPHRTTPIESGERYNFVLWYHVEGAEGGGGGGGGAAPPPSSVPPPSDA